MKALALVVSQIIERQITAPSNQYTAAKIWARNLSIGSFRVSSERDLEEGQRMPAGTTVGRTMKRTRFTEEQIIGILKEAEASAKTPELARRHGDSSAYLRQLVQNP